MFSEIVNSVDNKLGFNNCDIFKSFCDKLDASYLVCEMATFDQVTYNYYFFLLYLKPFINTLVSIQPQTGI